MNFFRYLPTINYLFGDSEIAITQTTAHIILRERLKQNITVLYDYLVQDEDRPDTVSNALYGTPQYAWVILLVNNMMSLFDWPLTQREIDAVLAERYGSLTVAQSTWLYKTAEGFLVDVTTYGMLPAGSRSRLSVYDQALLDNDAKRRIKVVPASFVGLLASELQHVFA